LPFGNSRIGIDTPASTDILGIRDFPAIENVNEYVTNAFRHPIGSPPLGEIIRKRGIPEGLRVAVALSDITRPIPYRGDNGILLPLLRHLENEGIRRHIFRAYHRNRDARCERHATEDSHVRHMMLSTFTGSRTMTAINLRGYPCLGEKKSGSHVFSTGPLRRRIIRICTGLVESHFMAGFSGGR
jgi:nickel-dependent lactate racemase